MILETCILGCEESQEVFYTFVPISPDPLVEDFWLEFNNLIANYSFYEANRKVGFPLTDFEKKKAIELCDMTIIFLLEWEIDFIQEMIVEEGETVDETNFYNLLYSILELSIDKILIFKSESQKDLVIEAYKIFRD